MRRIAELRLSEKDKMVINAFIDQKPAESKKLLTNGMRLDGVWMGGSNIAHWEGGRIVTNDLGSKAAQTVQNFLKRNTPKNLLRTANMRRTASEVIRELEMRVARLERQAIDPWETSKWIGLEDPDVVDGYDDDGYEEPQMELARQDIRKLSNILDRKKIRHKVLGRYDGISLSIPPQELASLLNGRWNPRETELYVGRDLFFVSKKRDGWRIDGSL